MISILYYYYYSITLIESFYIYDCLPVIFVLTDSLISLDTLIIQLRPISSDFRLFGSVAGISPVKLDQIVATSSIPYDGLVEVCNLWLEKCHEENTPPTWCSVAEILTLIGHKPLADAIMKVYTTGKFILCSQKWNTAYTS